jgi:hypothetical protein
MQYFAKTSLFGNTMIVLAIVTVIVYGIKAYKEEDRDLYKPVPFLNEKTFTTSIGFSCYAFEGIGLIIPV